MKNIHIFASANNEYSKPLTVMLHSLLSNASNTSNLSIHILCSTITEENKMKIRKALAAHPAPITFWDLGVTLFEKNKLGGYWSKEIYYKLMIPELLDETYEKAIYLDCDLIVKGDITELWRTDLGDFPLAAVEDCLARRHEERLRLAKRAVYFNAGVLVLNLKVWRQEKLKDRILDYLEKNHDKITVAEQDGINGVVNGRFLLLDEKWNYHVLYRRVKKVIRVKSKKSGRLIRKVTKYKYIIPEKYHGITPKIIHFTGRDKPWINNHHLFYQEYAAYESLTLWQK